MNWDCEPGCGQRRAGVPPARRASAREPESQFAIRFANRSSRGTRSTFWFVESPIGLATVHWDHEPVWVAPLVRSPAFRRPDRLKPELQTAGAWRASTAVVPRMATLNPDGGTQPSGCSGLEENRFSSLKAAFLKVGSWRASFSRGPSRAGRKALVNWIFKRFALRAESADHAPAFGVRASSAPLFQGRLRFDVRPGSWRTSTTMTSSMGDHEPTLTPPRR